MRTDDESNRRPETLGSLMDIREATRVAIVHAWSGVAAARRDSNAISTNTSMEVSLDGRDVARPHYERRRTVHLVSSMEFESTTGGATQWLTNTSGRDAQETIEALVTIGARRVAALLSQLCATLPVVCPFVTMRNGSTK